MPQRTDSPCPVARALDVIGERWTLLILRDLYRFRACRFQDLLVSLRGIAPNTLSARLKTLEDQGLVQRRFYSEHPPRAEYLLSERGRTLGPVLKALYDWGMGLDAAEGRGGRKGRRTARETVASTRAGR